MNACQKWKDRLLDAAVGAPISGEMECHLLKCPDCSAAWAELRSRCEQMDDGLRQLVRETKPSPAFLSRLLASLEAHRIRTDWSAAWAAALAIGMVGVAWFIPRWADRPQQVAVRTLDSSLSQWRSPTASLLRSPGEEFWQSNLSLGEFYFQIQATPTKAYSEGTKRRKP